MKKIIVVLAISLSIFLIYYYNKDDCVYYVALGNKENKYYNLVKEKIGPNLEEAKFEFLKDSSGIRQIRNQIKKNEKKGNQTIKNALIKADLVTISFKTDIISNNESDFIRVDESAKQFEDLMKLIKSYCKETVIVIGPNDKDSGSLKYLNKTFRNIAADYDVYYVKEDNYKDISIEILNKIK